MVQVNFYPLFIDLSFKDIISSSGIIERGETIENEFIAEPWNLKERLHGIGFKMSCRP